MTLLTIILVIVVLMIVFGGNYGYRQGYVTGPANYGLGFVGFILLVLVVLLLFGVFTPVGIVR